MSASLDVDEVARIAKLVKIAGGDPALAQLHDHIQLGYEKDHQHLLRRPTRS